jgi:hypothetical protein
MNKQTTIVLAVIVTALVALHFLDRPEASAPTPAPIYINPGEPLKLSRKITYPHVLAASCGKISGTEKDGKIVVAKGAPSKCIVTFTTDERASCTVIPGRYTVIPDPGRIEIVGGQPGETLTYHCERSQK